MFEAFIILRSGDSNTIPNPSERLHGAIISLLTLDFDVDKVHGENRVRFALSPIYSMKNFKMVRKFKKGERYFFRFASTGDELGKALGFVLAMHPLIFLANSAFEVEEFYLADEFSVDPGSMNTLYFVSPVTFRISKNVNLPLPDPERISKGLSRVLGKEVSLPPIKEIAGYSKSISFSHHTVVGFVGFLKFNKPFEHFNILNFTGVGYSTARGLGSTLVNGIVPLQENVKELREGMMEVAKKRCRG